MKRVLLTGMSGTGKSSVIAELAALGYTAVDTDDGWCEPLPGGRQQWREDAIAALLDAEGGDVLFIAGCEENQARFRSRFDLVILLSAPAQVMTERLAARAGNPYGKAPGDMARILADLAAVEPLLRKSADHEIRTTVPLAEVVAKVLHLAGLCKTGPVLVSSYITPKARKGVASGIEGRGLAALAPIGAGETVAIKGGHIVTTAALHSLPERLQNSEIQIADGFHLAALEEAEYEPVMLFINHSCEPNVGFAGNIVLVAMRDISAGEELTTDYALFDDYDGTMECRCGTPSCRRTVSGRDWQRPDLQLKYGSYFSSYLLRRL